MNLIWQPIDNDGDNDGRPYVIAAQSPMRGPGSRVAMVTQFQHERATEHVAYPRAEEADHFDRGNQVTTMGFTVQYEFNTYRECLQFCAGLADAISGRGNLRIEYNGGGFNVLPRAVWQAIPVPGKLGTVVTINFVFIGGKLT